MAAEAKTKDEIEKQVIDEVLRRGREDIRNGDMTVKLVFHDGRLVGGELVDRKIKLR